MVEEAQKAALEQVWQFYRRPHYEYRDLQVLTRTAPHWSKSSGRPIVYFSFCRRWGRLAAPATACGSGRD